MTVYMDNKGLVKEIERLLPEFSYRYVNKSSIRWWRIDALASKVEEIAYRLLLEHPEITQVRVVAVGRAPITARIRFNGVFMSHLTIYFAGKG